MPDWLDRLAQTLDGRFRLDREIGSGGMATVYLAQDLRHHRPVAIKVLRPDVALALGRERFVREIAIAAPLAHPNIVAILDSGGTDEALYYVMPYLPGESLRARLQREGELPLADALHLVRGVLRALAHAHSQGIVHRDLKPENILLAGGEPLLADFGIARALGTAPDGSSPPDTAAERLTATGLAVGTTAYMSPEQASGDPRIDHRTDLYALGMVWYEMLAGAHPFAALSPQQQVAAHFTRTIDPLPVVRPGVPPPIGEMVARCLEKRPADRWQDAGALLRQLEGYLEGSRQGAWTGVSAEPSLRSFRLDEELLATLPGGFDPRMPGDAISYLDNGRLSDTLVCYLTRWSIDAEDAAPFLRQTQYRAIAPMLFGFEAGRRYRVSLPLDDHLVLQRALLTSVARAMGATRVIAMGFSTGADLVMRLAAAPAPPGAVPIDGVLALGGNLARDTAFLSSVLAETGDAREDEILPFLRRVTESQARLQDWLDVNEYLGRMVRRFRSDFGILRDFAHDVASPFDEAPLLPFVTWYRDAARHGTRVRCVFEDNATYRRYVRQLQPGRESPLLGDVYQPGSLVIEAGAGHFDLDQVPVVLRYLDAFVRQLRGG